MHNAYRTPSPEKTDPEGNRKHSPWTAQRARKKNRSSPDFGLPSGFASLPEDGPLEGEARPTSNVIATELAVHLSQNPFLGAETVDAGLRKQSSLAFTVNRPFAFHASQEAVQGPHSFPLGKPGWPICPSRTAEHQQIVPSIQPAVVEALSLDRILHSTSYAASTSQSIETIASVPSKEIETMKVLLESESKKALPCLALHSQNFLQPVNRCIQQQSLLKTDENVYIEEELSRTPNPALTRVKAATGLQDPSKGFGRLDLSHGKCEPIVGRMPEAIQNPAQMLQDSPGHIRSPLQEVTPDHVRDSSSVAPTPSPGVPAPGLRLDHQGCVPPRVSTCRTIRRVLVSSPQSSRGRPWSTECNSAPMSVDKAPLTFQLGRPQPIQEATATHPTEHAECESYQYGSNLTWMTATPETAEESEADYMDSTSHSAFEEESPDFVLAKGHITPNNLLPGWDDEDEGPWGPRKGYYTQPLRRRSGQLATFDERLQEAIENGDAVTLGQAWRDVRSGNVKPDDIDTLNALLKCYCKVEGDPEEAEEIVKEACRDGRLLPNASTYHHMASLWTRHDQLNNSE